jgi:hypothetical protein
MGVGRCLKTGDHWAATCFSLQHFPCLGENGLGLRMRKQHFKDSRSEHICGLFASA